MSVVLRMTKEEAVSKIKELHKILKQIAKHGCTGPGAYDALPCKGYVDKRNWCGACLAKEAINGN